MKTAVSNEVKQFLVLQDICPQSDTRIIRGETLNKVGLLSWVAVTDTIVPAGTTIHAGSVIEKTEAQAKRTPTAFVDASETRHFDLEIVFDKTVDFFSASPKDGIPGKPATLSDVLRAHSIFSLEDVLGNKTGLQPFIGGSKKGKGEIKAQDVLKLYAADTNELNAWLDATKKAVAK